MNLEVNFTNQFKKDVKLASKQHRDLDLLFEIIKRLSNKETLEPKFNDHRLSGNYSLCRECHIGPDFLLIYQIYDDINLLILIRVGCHSELFK